MKAKFFLILIGVLSASGNAFAQASVNEALESAFIYVDTANGSDSNPGTSQLPLKTISASVAIALKNNASNIGTKVIINPGTYRESILINSNKTQNAMPMTFQAATNGTVYVSGAVQYTSWAAYTGNSSIYTSAWPNRWGACAADGGNAPLQQDIVLRREMIFVNGTPLTQVLALSQMIYPGTFFVDETAGLVYVWPPSGTNMTTADIEVATNPNPLIIQSQNGQTLDGVVIRGLTFEYANPCHHDGSVLVQGTVKDVLFDNDTFVWNNGHGLMLDSPVTYATVQNSTSSHNGASGFQAVQLKNVLWQNLQASYNNWRGAQGVYYSWNTGGIHIFSDHGDTISGINLTYNQTHTIHWDTDNQNIVANAVFASGNVVGVSIEKNEGPLTISNSQFCNIVGSDAEGGLVFRNSEMSTVTGTTVYNNGPNNLMITGVSGGIVVTDWETGLTHNLITQNVTLNNNILEGIGSTQLLFKDGALGGADWTAFQTTFIADHNTYWEESNATPFTVPSPTLGASDTFAQWQTLTGQDVHSTFAAPAVDPAAACTVAADMPDYWLLVDHGFVTADATGTATLNLTLFSLGGLTGNVKLSVDGVSAIPGATVTFSPSTVALGGSSLMKFVAGNTTPAGTYVLTVLANTGNITRTAVVSVTVPSTSIRLSTTSLAFASQEIGTTSAPLSVTVTNDGATALTISTITVNYGFSETNTCGLSLAAGATCTISVTFSPHTLTTYSGTLTINDSDVTSPQTVSLTGTSIGAPTVSLSPASLSFGSQVYASRSATKTVQLTNTGTADLNITSVAITGANSGDFSQTNTCPSTVVVGGTCVITVAFTPAGIGQRTASVTVTDNAVVTTQTASLTGSGTTAITVTPKSVTFSSTTVGSTSSPKTVTVTNGSTAAIGITSLTFTGSNATDFLQTNTCGASLPGGSSCTISVTFAPQAAGSRSGSLSIADTDPSSPQVVSLSGTGQASTVSLSPTSLSFPTVVYLTPSASQNITLTNTASTALTITSVTVTGTNAADYSQTNTCGTKVTAGSSCVITVTFTPQGLGTRSASITITDSASGSTQSASLTGTGSTALTFTPLSLTFPSTTVGVASAAQTITVTNASAAAIGMTSFVFSGTNASDFKQTNTCGTSLSGGKTCTISVTFTPADIGSRTASLSITTADPASPQVISISGTGAGSTVVLTPASLAFGNDVYLTPSATQSISVKNAGSSRLSITSITVTGTNSADYTQTNTCKTSLAVGATCTITVTFTPTGLGVRNASISIVDSATGSPQTAALSGTGTAAISVSPASLTFAATNVGSSSSPQTVTVTNAGTAAIAMSSFTFTGSNASDFSQTNTCGSSLAGGATCTVSVTFKPAAAGSRSASLSIADSDPASPQVVTLTGTGAGTATVLLTPTSLVFGNEIYLKPSASQAITLTNTGTAALTITSVTVSGTNSPDFTQVNTCGTSVAAGGSCTITVTFTPTGLGVRNASISIADSATGSPQTAGLTGTGTAAISVSPASLTFAATNVGSSSSPQTVTVTNAGTAAITMTSFTFTGSNASDFSQTNTCGSSLAGGAACTVSVTFKPAATGSRSASLSIADSDPASPQVVALTGTGTSASVLRLTPSSLSFGNVVYLQPSAPQSITMKNTGTAALTITSLTVTGTNSSDFSQTNTCGTSVAAGASCTITVTFTATGLGVRNASVSISYNATGSPQTAALTGTGTAAISVSPASLTFASTNVGSSSSPQTVTVTNASTAAITMSSFTFTGSNASDFSQTNTCGSSLAGGAACTVSVTFKPAAAGSRSASLSIADSDPASPQVVTLTGTGAGTAIVLLTPTSLVFGNEIYLKPSASQAITLTNTGTAALTITSLTVSGTNSSDFTQVNTCGTSVAAGGSCTITVTFTPTALGVRNASISIADSATGSPQTAALTGTGTAAISVSPALLTFAATNVGSSSSPQTVTVTNAGTAAITMTSFTFTGSNASDFSETNTCGSSLAGGAACTVSVTFKPVAAGSRSASLSIADSDPASPQVVTLTGTATTAPVLRLTPSSLAFGNVVLLQPSASQSITLKNAGRVALKITSVTVTGTNSSDFSQTNTCGSSVAAGASCTITVTFTPTALGIRDASISIATKTPGSPQTAALTGTGVS